MLRLASLASVLLIASLALCCAACRSTTGELAPRDFTITATPTECHALPGQRCVLLVSVADVIDTAVQSASATGGAVTVSATCPGAQVSIEHAEVANTEVAEITVVPGATAPAAAAFARAVSAGDTPDWTITVAISAERDGIVHTASVPLGVITGWDDLLADAVVERDRAIPWLAAQHPELGITAATQWTPAMPAPLLIVSHYLFFSDEWELHVYWHVMIPPYDWTKYELRRRFSETGYSQGNVINSRSTEPAEDPVPMEPESTLWR